MRLRECAVHMDNAYMREYADAEENLIHIYQHTQYYRGKKWAKTKYQKEFFHRVILWGTYLRYVDFRRILAVEMLKLFATVSEIYGQMMIFFTIWCGWCSSKNYPHGQTQFRHCWLVIFDVVSQVLLKNILGVGDRFPFLEQPPPPQPKTRPKIVHRCANEP